MKNLAQSVSLQLLENIAPSKAGIKQLALFADELDLTREEEKAWSQNFDHEHVRKTRESYGALSEHR